jgi:hypothetical protein
MRRNRKTLVRRRKKSPNRHFNFTVKSYRFRRSLGTDARETAEIIAAKMRSDVFLGNLTHKEPGGIR